MKTFIIKNVFTIIKRFEKTFNAFPVVIALYPQLSEESDRYNHRGQADYREEVTCSPDQLSVYFRFISYKTSLPMRLNNAVLYR